MWKVFTIQVLIVLFVSGCWIGNLIKFVRCDFASPVKGEIIHGIGLVPTLSIFTMWNNNK